MSDSIDNPAKQDNRRYDYTHWQRQVRAEYGFFVQWIDEGAKVVDFGCGNGSLLELLRTEKKVSGIGYDVSPSAVEACRAKGIDAVCQPADQPHPELADGQFDYAICNVTLQMVMYPEVLFGEMARVARRQIVSFPNFACLRNRLEMFFRGRMPRTMLYGYDWFSTGHIHQFSLSDFHDLVRKTGGLRVSRSTCAEGPPAWARGLRRIWPNLFQWVPIVMTERI